MVKAYRSYSFHKTLEWFFFLGAIVMTAVTFIAFVSAYFNKINPEFFILNSHLYWIVVILYAAIRQIGKRMFPTKTGTRKGELFIVFWLLTTITFAVITMFIFPENLEIMKDLVFLFGVLSAILGAGEVLKHMMIVFFG